MKDNIDLAGHPTTAACPEFAYTPPRSAAVVERLCAAGAIVVGKTNLDQFAAGLVGTRSPYGTPRNRFDPDYIPGGSSSGSAVAVAAGLVSFAVGTDTAGSGRVPAAFNNLVGLKPTRGVVSAAGAVPACRSLDCVSFFALTCADARTLFDLAKGYDAADPHSRDASELPARGAIPEAFRFGVPAAIEAAKAVATGGKLVIFKGPLKENAGAEVIPAGKEMVQTDPALEGMQYLVEGVIGSAK